MTIGIYKISFNGTDKVYIGQSNNIESRFISHLSHFRLGKAAKKLQTAFDTYGIENMEVILECPISELDGAEKEAIEIFDSYINGFNSIKDASTPILYGSDNPFAGESNDTYMEILAYLVQDTPKLSKREISNITGVSIFVIRHIAALESHSWLKECMPVEYKKLEDVKATKPYNRGTDYNILSPEGIIYTVEHLTNFAKEHGLLQPKLTEVLNGTRNHHKGWRRVDA